MERNYKICFKQSSLRKSGWAYWFSSERRARQQPGVKGLHGGQSGESEGMLSPGEDHREVMKYKTVL